MPASINAQSPSWPATVTVECVERWDEPNYKPQLKNVINHQDGILKSDNDFGVLENYYNEIKSIKRTIALAGILYDQLGKLNEAFSQDHIDEIGERASASIQKILEMNPAYYSFSVTEDESVFHTFTFGDIQYHLEHYLFEEDGEECLITYFIKGGKSMTTDGAFNEIIDDLKSTTPMSTGASLFSNGFSYQDFTQAQV